MAKYLDHIPAIALGRSPADDPLHLWSLFGLEGSPLIEQCSVAALVRGIGEVDRSELPSWYPLYSDTALWELHRRLAVLVLLILGAFGLRPLVEAAIGSIWSYAANPVLVETVNWADEPIASLPLLVSGRTRAEEWRWGVEIGRWSREPSTRPDRHEAR